MNSIEEYFRLAEEWGAFMSEGDSDNANRLHQQIQDVFQKILKEKKENDLFDRVDTVGDVACFWIASHLKKANPSKARTLYDRLCRSSYPFVSLSAKWILKGNDEERR
jgi:hypothetical protein